jgi:hypothetical protein
MIGFWIENVRGKRKEKRMLEKILLFEFFNPSFFTELHTQFGLFSRKNNLGTYFFLKILVESFAVWE